jgi:amino acid adenylation domain-containing protein
MLSQPVLHQFLTLSAQARPDQTAVEEPGQGALTYRELDALSDLLRDRLIHIGVRPGDRVGIYLHKSIESVAAIFGILKTGATYVPVDPGAPAARNAYILSDCAVAAVVIESAFVDGLVVELGNLSSPGKSSPPDKVSPPGKVLPPLLCLEGTGGGGFLRAALERAQTADPAPHSTTHLPSSDDLAYILYTSGSTGKPKGVMLSHRAAISFVDWCSQAFAPSADDRFSSHAPFHFDLSILDIYLPLKHGATLVLISEEVGKDPLRLARLIAESRITSWYSTPSILSLLAQYGRLEQYDFSALRTVHFAGEVFPVKHLRAVKQLWPRPRYFNLYGPTETNVCTYYEIPPTIPETQTQPFPIGRACSHYRVKIAAENGNDVPTGEEGELYAGGPGVMDGYWNLAERTAAAFWLDEEGRRWYKTGDVVYEAADGNIIYVGRRDRMVKKRGYRVELGEIEAGLYRHSAVKEAAVIALMDEENGVRIKAFLSCRGEKRPSLIELKRFCADNLPVYMVPDLFSFHDVLPKTSTDKINYQELKQM